MLTYLYWTIGCTKIKGCTTIRISGSTSWILIYIGSLESYWSDLCYRLYAVWPKGRTLRGASILWDQFWTLFILKFHHNVLKIEFLWYVITGLNVFPNPFFPITFFPIHFSQSTFFPIDIFPNAFCPMTFCPMTFFPIRFTQCIFPNRRFSQYTFYPIDVFPNARFSQYVLPNEVLPNNVFPNTFYPIHNRRFPQWYGNTGFGVLQGCRWCYCEGAHWRLVSVSLVSCGRVEVTIKLIADQHNKNWGWGAELIK